MTAKHSSLELAIEHHQAGRLAEAEEAYLALLAVQPRDATVLGLLGLVCQQAGRSYEAINHLRTAIELDPNNAAHHCNLGTALATVHHFAKAIDAYQTAISLQLNFAEAHGNLANAYKEMGEIELAITSAQHALSLKKHAAFASNLLYFLHFHPRYDPTMIASAHAAWRKSFADPRKPFIQPHRNDPNPERRLRVGFVLPQLCDHPVTRFLLPYLTNADKSEFELFCYYDEISEGPIADLAASSFASNRKVIGLNDVQCADLIRDDQIDILVDLTMHTTSNRLSVFAQKPAPVQVTYLAYAGTTGLDTIDYRLSDAIIDPSGCDESVYSEKTVRLETFWCYWHPPEAPAVGPLPALSAGHITFGSLNSYAKSTSQTLDLWSRVLNAVSGSRLLLFCPEGFCRDRAAQHLERNGIDSGRLSFAGPMTAGDYFARYNQIDVALDPFPYPGGTTSCDALWMGVPVITLTGRTAVSRGGKSILSVIGLTGLIAQSEDEYVQIAARLAGDLPRLADLRTTMRSRMENSLLMDGPRFAMNMERVLREMWRSWCDSAVPNQETE